MRYKKSKGQSTVEYLVMFGAVVAIIVAVVRPTGLFGSRLQDALQTAADGMVSMVDRVR